MHGEYHEFIVTDWNGNEIHPAVVADPCAPGDLGCAVEEIR